MAYRGILSAVVCLTLGASAHCASAQQAAPANAAGYPAPSQGSESQAFDYATIYGQAGAAVAQQRLAYEGLDATVTHLEREFQMSDDYRAALREVDAAHSALDSSRKAVMDTVANSPDYRDLAEKHDRVSTVLSEGNLPTSDVIDLAIRKMQYGSQMRHMEAEAFGKDSAVQSARTRLTNAQQKVDDMRNSFQVKLYQNPQWAAAKKAFDNATIAAAGATAAVDGLNTGAQVASDADARRAMYNSSATTSGIGDPYYMYPHNNGRY